MKRIISLMMAFAMLFSVTVAFADPAQTLQQKIQAEFDNMGLDVDLTQDINIPVATDIEVKKVGGEYQDSPVSIYSNEISTAKFGLKARIDMSVVRTAFELSEMAANNIATPEEKDSMYVTGNFVVQIEYPNTGFKVDSASYIDEETVMAMDGFYSINEQNVKTEDYKDIFEETEPRILEDLQNGYSRLTINVYVKEGTGLSELSNKLSDLVLEYDDNSVTRVGDYTIRGSITGQTDIRSNLNGSDELIGHIEYGFSQWDGKENDEDYRTSDNDISATIKVVETPSSPPSGGLGGGGTLVKKVDLKHFDGDDMYSGKEYVVGSKVRISDLVVPVKDGYAFAGFYFDEEFTQPVTGEFIINEDTHIYVKWAKSVLNSVDHFAYIIGYPMEDGREEVRPEINMTREEIATVFYRLLNDEIRDELFTAENSFPDVEVERWSNKAISTMANGGYVNGYEDDTFRPGRPITRAEFVTIAARFYDFDEHLFDTESSFDDVGDHWARKYINYATTCGWIDGYEDNTFRPDRPITRAEVMKIINHMLNRDVDEEGLTADTKRWIDNAPEKWYYYEVIEATNFHSYERPVVGEPENWTAILVNQILVDKPKYEDA